MPEEIEEKKFVKRSPSKQVPISRIKEMKGRVSVIGTVVSKNVERYTFVIDDGEAQVLIITNDADQFENVKEGKPVRVLGKTIGEGDETEILSEVIQDFSKFDLNLWKKVQIK